MIANMIEIHANATQFDAGVYLSSCGACSFIGTASTLQIMAEALGLALPGSALMPATSPDLLDYAIEAGRQTVRLAKMKNMRPSDIVTPESFENAILVHAAISGSTKSASGCYDSNRQDTR